MAKRTDHKPDLLERWHNYMYIEKLYDGCVLTPESFERVLKENYAPDPEIDKLFEGFSFDAISDEDDEDGEVGEEPLDENGPNEPNA